MPPKPKFTRTQIIEAALNLIRHGGMPALTSRSLGVELGCSSQPIFTEFKNMEEVRHETIKSARTLYHSYVLGKGPDSDAFRRIDYIRFAKDEPRLFSIMFMTPKENEYSLSDILSGVFTNTGDLIASVQRDYALSFENAQKLCVSMWLFIHGIASLCATGMTNFIEDEVKLLVNETFDNTLKKLKEE